MPGKFAFFCKSIACIAIIITFATHSSVIDNTQSNTQDAPRIDAESSTSQQAVNPQALAIQASVHTAPWAVEWWLPRHQAKLNEIKQRQYNIDLVFLGDSITHNWESKGAAYWQDFYTERNALNLGFGGDRTEHVLWRLQNGAVENLAPKLVVLMIGTNNTGHRQDPAEETALGVRHILDELQERLPNSKILLLAILPRSAHSDSPLRVLNQEVNQLIKSYADNRSIFWLDMNYLFLDENGELSTDVMADLLHPESEQYLVWARAIEPYVERFVDSPDNN
jgi:beta-glucosidase